LSAEFIESDEVTTFDCGLPAADGAQLGGRRDFFRQMGQRKVPLEGFEGNLRRFALLPPSPSRNPLADGRRYFKDVLSLLAHCS
jgi:hypothetical protein